MGHTRKTTVRFGPREIIMECMVGVGGWRVNLRTGKLWEAVCPAAALGEGREPGCRGAGPGAGQSAGAGEKKGPVFADRPLRCALEGRENSG